MKKNLKYYLKKAQKEGWAIGQFNFSDFSQLKGIVAAAQKMRSPIILGTSEGESGFLGINQAVSLVKAFCQETKLPIYLNLDHGKNLGYLKRVAFSGYDAVHFDGSTLTLAENWKITKRLAVYAQPKGVVVEGGVGNLRGTSELHSGTVLVNETDLTRPEEAEFFSQKTGVDSLAVSIGNVHGVYEQMPVLDQERLSEIKKRTKVFLVLHGGSGFAAEEIKKAIENGIVKININTEIRVAWRKAIKGVLEQSEEVRPYKLLLPVVEAVQKVVEEKIRIFGSANKK